MSYSTRRTAAKTLGLIAWCAAVVACGGPSIYGTAPGPALQAKAALAGDAVNQDPKSKFRIGRVDSALQPMRGKALATSPYSSTALSYRGLKDGKVCFAFDYGAQYYRSHGSQKEAEAERAAGARINVFTFELRESLDDLDDAWPNPPKSQIVSSRVLTSTLDNREVSDNEGRERHQEWLETTIEICSGAAPKPVDRAHFLTATRYPPEGGRPPTFFIWAIEGGLRRGTSAD